MHVPDDRVALIGDEDEPNPIARVRTFVVLRDAVISSADVREATAGTDDSGAFVSVRIGDEASHRLEEHTRVHLRERLAFVAAGRVVMAPLIVSPIATRELRIGFGAVPDAAERARRWAEALTAGAIPSPLHLRPGAR
jgi:preprotein translocase subunit SecD